ncbi:MAG: YicC family protein [Planctomycetaceae bacterium]|nr:YicC family protein [Planctomycetaceae bacterium]
MLFSMTGYGIAVCRTEEIVVSVELKAVNNRYFKLSLRMSDGYGFLETRIEPLIRSLIERGTVSANIRIRQEKKTSDYKISAPVLLSYFEQLVELGSKLGHVGEIPLPSLDRLIFLPGVIETATDINCCDEENEKIWNIIEKALREALDALQAMRQAEGISMHKDLETNIATLYRLIQNVEQLAPRVIPLYQQKLLERISKVIPEQEISLSNTDLLREIAVYADRCDISEETVRFRSHLTQFTNAMLLKESCGRKLDFLTQELLRETNTMGSKANDADITKNVVEMKTVIERIREMVQNVE